MIRRHVKAFQAAGFVVGLLCGLVWSQMSPTSAEASRNGSGTYTLPSGNPVVSGTTITSTWANNTLNDIATELTSSLDRAGRGAMSAPLQLASGTSSAPGLTFSAENTSGIYRFSSNDVRMQIASTNRQKWTSTGSEFPSELVSFSDPGDGGAAISSVGGIGAPLVTTGTVVMTGNSDGGFALVATSGAGGSVYVDPATSMKGVAIRGVGGGTNGTGLRGEGVGEGVGVMATGVNGPALTAYGQATLAADLACSTSTICAAIAGGTTTGLSVTTSAAGGSAIKATSPVSTSSSRKYGLIVNNGDIIFQSGVVAPLATTSMTNTLTAANIIKAWATISLNNPPVLVTSVGFNVASISCAANEITVNLEADMTSTTYVATITGANTSSTIFSHGNRSLGSFNIIAYDAAGVVVNLCTYAPSNGSVNFMLVGVQ